jgi:hypothetical protein
VNRYVGRSTVKSRLGITDTNDDTAIDSVIESVSRQIDQFCNRRFFAAIETRYFTARSGVMCPVDDLLSVTTLATDDNADRTYSNSWAATDYELEPVNAALKSPPQPYTSIVVTPNGVEAFGTDRRAVKVVGLWGYYDQRTTSTATLAEDLDTSETAVDVSSGTAFEVGQTIRVDTEQMYISAISTNTLTVTRAVNGTTAAAHSNGAAISVYQYPVISEVALLQATRLFRRKDAPFGVVGVADFGSVRISRLDPDVREMLAPFIRYVVT